MEDPLERLVCGDLARTLRTNTAKDYGAAPSGRAEPKHGEGLVPSRPVEFESWDGLPAIFRIAFVGMPVPGLPERFTSGRVVILQTPGPIRSQVTYILQRPGWIPEFDKTMHKGSVAVGEGLVLTVCHLSVTVPDEHMSRHFQLWRDEVLGAVAAVAAMLDDRIAQQEVLEDLVVFDADGLEPVAMVDMAARVRDFPLTKRVVSAQHAGLRKLADWPSDAQTPSHVAARWYLRATHAGPTPDAIVFLWIALEALVPAKGGGKSTDVKGVEDALSAAGADPSTWEPSIGRCAGLRAKIVHHGEEQPELLAEGFYALEAAVRILLRKELGVLAESWPPEVHATTLRWPLSEVAERLRAKTRVTMRRV